LTIPAEMFPERELVRFEGRSLSYRQLLDAAAASAVRLAAAGIRYGSRVAAIDANTTDVLAALYAATALGASFAPLNFRARGSELADLLATAAPDLVLAGGRYEQPAREAAAYLVESIAAPSGNERAELVPVEVGEELAVLMFTSGTAARPKGVMISHSSLVEYVLSTTDPVDGSDRGAVLVCAPIHHIAGLTAVVAATFAGRRIVLMRQFDAGGWLDLVEGERVTHAFVVPTMLKRILEDRKFPTSDLSSLSVLSYGAAPMPLSLIRRAIDALPHVGFINAFGQTETTSTVTMLVPADHRLEGNPDEIEAKLRRLGSIGRPAPGVELEVVDESGAPVAPGEVGEIAVRSSRLMAGYEGAGDAGLRDGWLATGDLAWVDEAGYVFLAGRASDTIIRGGENIAPQQVEAVLESHAAVDEAAVVGVPDEEWGERVVAAVVTHTDASVDANELIEFCRERMAGFKRPEQILFVESLPRTQLGKVVRREVRMLFDERNGG